MTNYFHEFDIHYLDKLLEHGNFTLIFSRKNSNIGLYITESGKFVASIIGNSIGHTLKRADAFLRSNLETMPIVKLYVSSNLDRQILTSDYIIEIYNDDDTVMSTLYNEKKDVVFSAIDFNICNCLEKIEDFME